MIMKWAPPTPVHSGTLGTGSSHQEEILEVQSPSPAVGVGMLQLDTSARVSRLPQVSGTRPPGHPQPRGAQFPARTKPAVMEHDPDFPQSPFPHHSVTLSLKGHTGITQNSGIASQRDPSGILHLFTASA